MAVATKELSAAASAADPQPEALQQSLAALQQQFKGLSGSDLQQALAGEQLSQPTQSETACTHKPGILGVHCNASSQLAAQQEDECCYRRQQHL